MQILLAPKDLRKPDDLLDEICCLAARSVSISRQLSAESLVSGRSRDALSIKTSFKGSLFNLFSARRNIGLTVFQHPSGTPPRIEAQSVEIAHKDASPVGSRSVPIGTPPPLSFSLLHQCARRRFRMGSCLGAETHRGREGMRRGTKSLRSSPLRGARPFAKSPPYPPTSLTGRPRLVKTMPTRSPPLGTPSPRPPQG